MVCKLQHDILRALFIYLFFIFKDDEKAEDEMAKRRAAFLLKQQRKAEETRLRKQQQEAESELKRDEARFVSTQTHTHRKININLKGVCTGV